MSLARCSVGVVNKFSTITAKSTVIYTKLLSKCQISVPIHIDLNKLRTHFCARLSQ